MKKTLSILLSILLLTACVPMGMFSAVAEGVTEDGLVYEITNGKVTITGYTDDLPADLVISDTIEGYPVTTIDEYAFYKCGILRSVIIPEGVVNIWNQAFLGCDSLSAVTIPNSITTIWEDTFFDCPSLRLIIIPSGVTTLCAGAFAYCDSLTSVTIPDSVITILDSAFYNCDSLTDVYYGGSETDRANISIESGNGSLGNATWHYNYRPESEVSPGDANGDGVVNNRDLALLQQHINKWDVTMDVDAMDVNDDGAVNNRDLALLQQYINKWDVELK